jgi:TPP-dependent indolepyruvate ferredoxin oxidoreductase alpha subunit
MKKKLSEIVAQALYDAGAAVTTYVPGYGGTEVFAKFCEFTHRKHPISFNEEVAYSIAHGASLAGVRASSLMKAHGFVKAGNSVIDSLYAGTTAGFVTIIFNDKEGAHSDSILDIAAYLDGIGIPYRSGDPETIYQDVVSGFEHSERYQLPYALVVEASELDRLSSIESKAVRNKSCSYKREITQHVLCPFFSEYQHQALRAKRQDGDWTKLPKPTAPRIPDSLPGHWKTVAESYVRLFAVFQSIRGKIVTGDTGVSSLFAFPPYNCVDITTYMGGSIPLAIGAYLAGYHDVWALTGDFSFIAAGHLGLPEAVQRNIPLKIVLFYNGKAETTGGQPIPEGTLERTVSGYGDSVRYINDPQDRHEIESVLREAANAKELRIVIADYRDLRKTENQGICPPKV